MNGTVHLRLGVDEGPDGLVALGHPGAAVEQAGGFQEGGEVDFDDLGTQAARMMSTIMLVFSVSPILAPLAGSALIVPFGWRAVFVAITLADGKKVKGDDAFLKESIVNPNATIVKGFAANVMPATFGSQLKPEEIDNIVAYIKSLK